LYEYDKFTLASHLLSNKGLEILDQVLEWIPEYAGQLAMVELIKRETLEDEFDIEQFYAFYADTDSDNVLLKTLFKDLERSKELDQMIIGFWVKNHVKFDVMEERFMAG
jgi:hypothetical protein